LIRIWRKRPASPRSRAGTLPGTVAKQFDSFCVRALGEQQDGLLDFVPRVELHLFQFELSGLDAGKFQNLIDDV